MANSGPRSTPPGSLLEARERWLREVIGELVDRGHYDPFFPFASVRKLAIRRPVRTSTTQAEWEQALAEFAESFDE